MTKYRILSKEDLYHLAAGAEIIGTGGGGSITQAEQIIENIVGHNKEVKLITYRDIDDNATGLSTMQLGGGVTREDYERSQSISGNPMSVQAARELEKYLKKNIDYVFSWEIGPHNTLEPVQLAAFLDVPLVDGDFVGRSIPEMSLSTLALNKISSTPFSILTGQGDVIIAAKTQSEPRSEVISRALAGASGSIVCFTGFPIRGAAMKKAIIPGTISGTIEVGAIVKRKGKDMFSEIAEATGGFIAFKGDVTKFQMESRDSFFWGEVHLKGTDEFAGHTYRVWFKNEYLVSWKDDKVDITCPDLICAADSETGAGKVTYGQGFRNEIIEGENLTVLGMPAPAVWKTPAGLALFSPEHFGFDIAYRPFSRSPGF